MRFSEKTTILRTLNSNWHFILASVIFLYIFQHWNSDDNNYFSVPLNFTQIHNTNRKSLDIPVIVRWDTMYVDIQKYSPIMSCGNIKCKRFFYPDKIPSNSLGAYLFAGINTNFKDLPLPRLSHKILWGLYHDESPRGVMLFLHERILKLFNYSSTFSRFSDLPFPAQFVESLSYVTSRKYYVETKVKNGLLKEISPILFIQSNCDTLTDRDIYVAQLMMFQQIDSYGDCLNNRILPVELKYDYRNRLKAKQLFKFIARYKFVIAIENAACDDYVTEKFWRAIHLGVVPIYFGSPSIRDWTPNAKSAILLQDYPTPLLLSKHIDELMQDDELYEEYLEHKTKGRIANQNIINELKIRPYQMNDDKRIQDFECFLCNILHGTDKYVLHRVINKKHYNCHLPISAVTLNINTKHNLMRTVNEDTDSAQKIYDKVRRSAIDSNVTDTI